MKKTLIYSAVAMLLGASAANATVSGSVMLCDAHDWQRFAEAMEAQDQAALQTMAAEPELRVCEFYRTIQIFLPRRVQVLTLPVDALPPAPGPFPGQRPGEQLGSENDDGNSGNGGGSSSAAGPSPSGERSAPSHM